MSAAVQRPAVGPAGLSIRPYRRGDLQACSGIYVEGRRFAFTWRPPSSFQTDDFERDSQGEAVYVAELDGRVAGFLSLWLPERFIHLLFVDPSLHRRGVGKALLSHALEILGPRVWLKCQQGNLNALDFYRSQGWSVTPGGSDEVGPWSYVASPAALVSPGGR